MNIATSPASGTTDVMSSAPAALIVSLADAAEHPRELVGGKAWQLGRLLREGFAVPRGFVITTAAYDAFGASDALPDELMAALTCDAPRAIRSSAVAEDGAAASFAGQYETVLGVLGREAAIAALRRCWESARGEVVTDYAARIAHRPGAMAVIVQDMVDADAAGVTFTANPVTGAKELLIEATAGLGDALMAGTITPERWLVRPGSSPERQPGAEPVLTPAQAGSLAQLCGRIAERRGAPQDIEWAIAGDQIHVLQCRPITALPVEPTEWPPARQTWERGDEHFPEPVLPLASSAWLPAHGRCLRRAFARAGLPLDTIESRVFGGRVYSRVRPLGGPDHDEGGVPPRWVFWLLLRLVPAMRARMKAARACVDADSPMALVDAWEGGGREALEAATRALLDVDRAALSREALADHVEAVLAHAERAGDEHFGLIMLSGSPAIGQLGRLVARHLGWAPSRVLDLLQGYSAASAAPGRDLEALVAAVADDPEARRLLQDAPEQLKDHAGPGGDALRRFLDHRGHRVYSMALDKPTWAEDPTPLLLLVLARLERAVDRIDPRTIAAAAEAAARAAVADEGAWGEIEQALHRARRARPYQDESEEDVFEAFGVFRYAAVEAGKRLAATGALPDAGAVFFLTVGELVAALRTGRGDVDIARRRAEHRWALANTTPRVFGPKPGAPPDLPFPRSVDAFLGGIMWVFTAGMEVALGEAQDGDLRGFGCSPGQARGPVKVIASPESLHRLKAGDILVCHGTTAAWSVAFPLIGGLVTETGGPLSHPATLAREYGIPGVLSVAGATETLRDGQMVRLDGATGAVWIEERG